MDFINKGNFKYAKKELLKDNNNSVIKVFNEENKKTGILSNVIFTLKDVFATKNFPTTSSSNILLDFQAHYDATPVTKLINAGATMVAKVYCDELAMAGTGTYSRGGIIHHPLDQDRMVGGSSSGSAATFTNNIGIALASDTGDSVRLPASYIGAVGFKPSYGAVSRWGLFAYATSLDTVSWFTHNVNDSFLVAKVLYGADEKDLTSVNVELKNLEMQKPKKVAYLDCFDYLKDYVAKEYQAFIEEMEKEGIEVQKIILNLELLEAVKTIYEIISFSEASSNLSNLTGISFGQRIEGKDWEDTLSKTRSSGFGFMVQKRLTLGSFFLEEKNQQDLFLRAQKIRRLINDWYQDIFDNYDVLIFPSAKEIAPLLNNVYQKENNFMNSILTSANLVGNPSINFKLDTYNNLPFNISIDTKIYNDQKLFNYSSFLENMWKNKR